MGLGEARARGKSERIAVPAMPCPVAYICCILNFLVPGLGTIIAGFAVFCCSRNEDLSCCEKVGSFCASFFIGLLQLILTALLLVGWIWSCIWGVSFIGMSKEYYHDNPVMDDGYVVSQTPNVIVQQPQPSTTGGYNYGPQGAGAGPSYHQSPTPYQGPAPSAPPQEGQIPYQQPGYMQPGPYYGEPPPPYSPPGMPPGVSHTTTDLPPVKKT